MANNEMKLSENIDSKSPNSPENKQETLFFDDYEQEGRDVSDKQLEPVESVSNNSNQFECFELSTCCDIERIRRYFSEIHQFINLEPPLTPIPPLKCFRDMETIQSDSNNGNALYDSSENKEMSTEPLKMKNCPGKEKISAVQSPNCFNDKEKSPPTKNRVRTRDMITDTDPSYEIDRLRSKKYKRYEQVAERVHDVDFDTESTFVGTDFVEKLTP